MKYYPIFLDVNNRSCLVVGGGSVGTRKALMLLRCGAEVTVVSPQATEKLQRLAETKSIFWKNRPYETKDIHDAFLVIGATDDDRLNRQIVQDAQQMRKLCNIVDNPESCNFIVPSVLEKGDLVIAVSTSGKSPAYAKEIKKRLDAHFGEEHAVFLKLMGAVRSRLLRESLPTVAHKPIFEKLIQAGLVDMIRRGEKMQIDHKLKEILGEGYDFNTLIQSDE